MAITEVMILLGVCSCPTSPFPASPQARHQPGKFVQDLICKKSIKIPLKTHCAYNFSVPLILTGRQRKDTRSYLKCKEVICILLPEDKHSSSISVPQKSLSSRERGEVIINHEPQATDEPEALQGMDEGQQSHQPDLGSSCSQHCSSSERYEASF